MARPDAGDRLRRLLAVLPWLAREGRASLSDVAARTGMDTEELVAMLELAACCGLPPYTPDRLMELIIYDDQVEANVGPHLARPLRFSAAEGFTLAASARAILAVPGTDPDGALASALAKLESVLGDRTRVLIDIDEPSSLPTVRDALAANQSLDLEYYSASRDELTERRVDPFELFARDGHWYLDGWCHLAEGERRFRVDRIRSARPTGSGAPVARPRDGAAAGAVFAPGPEARRVRLLLPAGAEWVLEAYPSLEVAQRPDGRSEVVLAVGGEAWLERLLLRLGPEAEVLDPAELSGLAAGAARRVLARYR
jgi:proteasome accessory factor C